MYTIETTWTIREYDVWGNEEDGYEVNNSFNRGEITLDIPVEVCNPFTAQQFVCAYLTDDQIKEALEVRDEVDIETKGDDLTIYAKSAKELYPLGELHCISHASLSPIRKD